MALRNLAPNSSYWYTGEVCLKFPPKIVSPGLPALLLDKRRKSDFIDYSAPRLQLQTILFYVLTQATHMLLKNLGLPLFVSQILLVDERTWRSRNKKGFTGCWLGYTISCSCSVVLRPGIKWMVKHIPETSQKKDICFYLVILAFMLSPPITKQFHLHVKFGPFILGLVVPDGPPLGSALVEKLDPIISGFFLPIFATTCGIRVDPSSFKKISTFLINQSIGAVVTVVVKFGVSLALAMFCKMPMRDSLALAFVMISKGIVEIGYYSSMSDSMVISKPHYAFLIYMSTLIAIIVPILVKWLYDPSRKYLCFQKRTIMNSKPNQELRVLGCVHVPGNVNSIINLLNVCCPIRESSLALDVLHLVKLSGRATPLFIAHQKQELMTSDDSYSENVVIAFNQFERHNAEVVSLNVFTAVSPPNLMYEDICNLAIEHSTCFILLPFHRRWYIDGSIESEDQTIQSLNCDILKMAPCSVGILVEGRRKVSFSTFRDPPSSQSYSSYNIVVIFIGGKDDREALALAKRISQDESVSLTVIHLKAKNNIGTIMAESDRALDDEMLSGIKGSMRYLEEQVSDGPETSNFLRSIVEDYQLFIVGRRYKCEDPQTSGLELWCEFEEIGIIGDLLSSTDFIANYSVLIVQQQHQRNS
ncbi:hypothetical protein GQ457_04G009730 [Hibiscus cannabinus]